jgi:hypothetical protein
METTANSKKSIGTIIISIIVFTTTTDPIDTSVHHEEVSNSANIFSSRILHQSASQRAQDEARAGSRIHRTIHPESVFRGFFIQSISGISPTVDAIWGEEIHRESQIQEERRRSDCDDDGYAKTEETTEQSCTWFPRSWGPSTSFLASTDAIAGWRKHDDRTRNHSKGSGIRAGETA